MKGGFQTSVFWSKDRKPQSSCFPRAGMKPAFMQVKRFPGTSRGSIRGTRECGGLANLFEKAAYLWRAGSTKDYANMPTGLRGARGGTYGFMTWITVKRQVSKSSIHPLVLLLLGHHERSQIKKLCEKKKVAPWKLAHQLSAKSVSWSLKLGGHMFCRKRERQQKFPIWLVQQRPSIMAFTSPLPAFPVHLIIFLMDTNT